MLINERTAEIKPVFDGTRILRERISVIPDFLVKKEEIDSRCVLSVRVPQK